MRAIHLSVYGNPVDGLGMADVPEPKAPGANEVLVAIEYSPINPNDLLVAQGAYPLRPELPSVFSILLNGPFFWRPSPFSAAVGRAGALRGRTCGGWPFTV